MLDVKHTNRRTILRATAAIAGMVMWSTTLVGCLAMNANSSAGTGTVATTSYDVNKYPINKLACDPMGNQTGGTSNMSGGLAAKMYYLPSGSNNLSSVYDYYTQGKLSSQYLFFTELNVPTRLFTEGFPLQTGGLIKDDTGAPLLENFALQLTTVLQLGPNDDEGDYEFALLADDGAVLSMRQDDGTYLKIVSDDGLRPTQMGCSSGIVHMTKTSQIVTTIDYYQGPRYEIALVPMWRKVVNGVRVPEPQCGKNGNDQFFDPNNSSAPTANYAGLLARGWQVIGAANYQLPDTYDFNPCVGGDAPNITNFKIVSDEGQYFASWTTDIPATSQVHITAANGYDMLSVSDNVLTTDHLEPVNFPSHGTFDVQVVSVAATNGKALSGYLEITY